MERRIIYSSVKTNLKKFFKDENIKLPNFFFGNFLKFVSKICTYEEEETKIRPNIILGYNVAEAFSQIPYKSIIPVNYGKRSGDDLERILKALLPFCNNGWFVYINVGNTLEYGLIRAFGGPQGLSATEILFNNNGSDLLSAGYGLIEIKVLSKYELCMTGLRRNKIIVDFRLLQHSDNICDYAAIATDITSNIVPGTNNELLNKVFVKILKLASQRVHGTILLIVNSNCILPNNFLSDGIWLKEPINLAEKALQASIDNCDTISNEAFYALSGLLLEMMNVDGITVIDNCGRVRGFNVFVKSSETQASGGARKRAAKTILSSADPNCIGVYFQSQDGNSFYGRVNNDA